MTTDTKEAARASARICPPCTGDCSQGRNCPAQHTVVFEEPPANGCYIDFNDLPPRKVVYMSPEEYAEMTQRPMPWTGLTIAAAIVCFCAWVALLVHAAGVHGWLR